MPWGDDWNKSNDDLIGECCRTNCHMLMASNKMTCAAGTAPRSEHDWHDPCYGDVDCSKKVGDKLAHIKKECCRKNCWSVMTEKGYKCDGGKMRDKGDGHPHRGDDWFQAKSETEIKKECCRKNCWSVMTSKG